MRLFPGLERIEANASKRLEISEMGMRHTQHNGLSLSFENSSMLTPWFAGNVFMFSDGW